jgi:hypothetical protein
VTVDLDIAPVTPHVLLHFRGHKCTDCEKCEECSKLLAEEPPQKFNAHKDRVFKASDECPECTKLFGEHDPQQIKACTDRVIQKRKKV